MKEFKVNKSITLKLENNKTNIYIKGELLIQCKFLIMNIPIVELETYDEINSIDEAVEMLDNSIEGIDNNRYNITAEEEFWAHCSNLQAWFEHDYDTKLLHSNLSFAILEKLRDIGDPLAKRKFKKELVNRFLNGSKKIKDFLIEEGYMNILSREELFSLIDQGSVLFEIERSIGYHLKINDRYSRGFLVENGEVSWLSLNNCKLKKIPRIINKLKSLKGLTLRRNSLVTLPEWVGDLNQLEVLDVSNN